MIDALIQALEELSWNCEAKFYGIYKGYSMFEGVAFTAPDASILFNLGVAIGQVEELEELTTESPIVNTLGRGVIIAWPTRLFSEEDLNRIRNGEFDSKDDD